MIFGVGKDRCRGLVWYCLVGGIFVVERGLNVSEKQHGNRGAKNRREEGVFLLWNE